MQKPAAIQILNDTFNNSYDKGRFIHFLRNFFNEWNEGKATSIQSGSYIYEPFRSHIAQYERLGQYEDTHGELLDVLAVKVKDARKLEFARTALRNFVIEYLSRKGYERDKALVAFYTEESPDWRFSFVKLEYKSKIDEVKGKKKIKVEKRLSPAKRYSFLVGPNEPNHTAREYLIPILQESIYNPSIDSIEEAFSVEKVTKEFFNQYKDLFIRVKEALDKNIGQHSDLKKEFEARNISTVAFAKKLMGQLVFLFFLQKKRWLGGEKSNPWESGQKKFLQSLFEKYSQNGQNYFDYVLRYLFYEALALDRHDPYYSRFDTCIPFLNGGLFDPINEYNWKEVSPRLPNELFSNTFETKDGLEGTGILDVLGRYNFTVKEDDPLDREVAVDPEMLGKVFENLLDITDRRSKGAFYTPREIVQYMSQESLIYYLKTECQKKQIPIERDDIAELVRKARNIIETETKITANESKGTERYPVHIPAIRQNEQSLHHLDQFMADVKVCDPAIGSGAFPVILMNEIVLIRQALAAMISGKIPDAFALKKHVISQSLYGVDLEKDAVEIARLRFWLSLVVDKGTPDEPLPNLDFKIMQGNSLVERSFEGINLKFDFKAYRPGTKVVKQTDLFGKVEESQTSLTDYVRDSKSDIIQLIRDFFGERNRTIKRRIKAQIDAFEKEFLHRQIAKPRYELEEKIQRMGNRTLVEKSDIKLLEDYQKDLAQVEKAEKRITDINPSQKPYFLWHLYFMEVFREKGGFDIVIGNPPYVQIQKFSGQQIQKDLNEQDFSTFTRTGDIYSLFYEKGNQILRPGGILAYITSNKWMRAKYGESTRKYFVDQTNPLEIIDFGMSQNFDSATTYTNILIFEKAEYQKNVSAVRVENSFRYSSSISDYIAKEKVMVHSFNKEPWVVLQRNQFKIKELVQNQGIILDEWGIDINYGIKTGLNDAFIIDTKIRNSLIAEDPKNEELIKPLIRGRDVERWYPGFEGNWIISIFPSRNIDISEYPRVVDLWEKQDLMERLVPKPKGHKGKWSGRKSGSYKWYETQDSIAYWKDFSKPKIIYPNMTKYLPFAYDEEGFYTNQKCFIITGNHLKYLVSFFNSPLFRFCYKDNFPELLGNTYELGKEFFKKISVKPVEPKEEEVFDWLVDYLVFLSKEKHPLSDLVTNKHIADLFERIVNACIYELYFEAHMKERELDVISYVQETIQPISESAEPDKIIWEVYQSLQLRKNPIRNRLKIMAVKSPEIIGLIQKEA